MSARDDCGLGSAECGVNPPRPESSRGDAETRSSRPAVPLRDSATPRDTIRRTPQSPIRNPPAPLSRREWLGVAGLAGGAALLAGCGEQDGDPYALEQGEIPGASRLRRGEEEWVPSTCGQCPAGCGIRVRVVDGRAVKVEGNPAHPVNRGGLGPKGQSAPQMLYHPDRVRGPLERAGARGAGRWQPISWDAAIARIAEPLRALRAAGRPEGLVLLDGGPDGPMRDWWARLLAAFGSPNHVDHRATGDAGTRLALRAMQGRAALPAYDWDGARYVLGFGAGLLESWCQTMHFARASSRLRRGVPGGRVKIVQVASRGSVSAFKADEWVPIAPGTEGALALGLAHVLIEEGLYDREFVAAHTFGFEDWEEESPVPPAGDGGAPARIAHRGFRTLVQKEYAPEAAATLTGVPADVIVRLAHELAAHRPALALADAAVSATVGGLGAAMAIHALNALLGNLERPGGVLVQQPPPLAPWPDPEPDAIARAGAARPRLDGAGTAAFPLAESVIQALPAALLAGQPYRAEAVFLYRSNPWFSKPDGAQWRAALAPVPLVVSFSPLADESTFAADLVLPDHTDLERWDLVLPAPATGRPMIGVRRPAVKPRHDTRATGDVVRELAVAIGAPVADAFAWDSYRDALLERLQGVQATKTGSVVEAKMPRFTRAVEQAGGWWHDEFAYEQWDRAFATPSGKFEFFSRTIQRTLARLAPDRLSDEVCLPHWTPPAPAGAAGQFPLLLVPARGIEHAEGGARHLPSLCELPKAGRYGWRESIELHPDDADRLGLDEGDLAYVESLAGARRMIVRRSPFVRPGTAVAPLGHGVWPPDPKDENPGALGLLVNRSDPLSGLLALGGTRVAVRKA